MSKRANSGQLFQLLRRRFSLSSSVHHYEGTKTLLCIMYALIDLIETENVMFHSGASLIDWPSRTRLARKYWNGGWVLINLKWWVGKYGREWLIVIVELLERWNLTGSLIIDAFFGLALCFTLLPLDGMKLWQRWDAPLCWLHSEAPNQTQLDAKWEQPRWHLYPTV